MLAYRSHFFEFLEQGKSKTSCLSDLKIGPKYKVILTNLGGIYRYDMGDIIEVASYWKGMSKIKFLGRDMYSDLVGEKLSELQVREIIKSIINIKHFAFVLLAPSLLNGKPGYIFFIESNQTAEFIKEISLKFERGLENNYYQHAKNSGQLGNLRTFKIENNAQEKYFERQQLSGQKLGDIKPKCLDTRTDWEIYFNGEFL